MVDGETLPLFSHSNVTSLIRFSHTTDTVHADLKDVIADFLDTLASDLETPVGCVDTITTKLSAVDEILIAGEQHKDTYLLAVACHRRADLMLAEGYVQQARAALPCSDVLPDNHTCRQTACLVLAAEVFVQQPSIASVQPATMICFSDNLRGGWPEIYIALIYVTICFYNNASNGFHHRNDSILSDLA